MYHHVGRPMAGRDAPFFVSAKRFKRQMDYLKKNNYDVIELKDLVDGLKGAKPLPGKPIVITFDDGTESVYKEAFPILLDHGFKATVFLTVNFIEKKQMQEKSFLKYLPLSWEEIKEMQANGFTFYPHSLSHPKLTQIEPEKAFFEITESKKILEEKLGKPMGIFSYPYGDINEEVKGMAIKAGYSGAVDAWGGVNTEDTDVYRLKRIPVFERDGDLQLRLKFIFGMDRVTLGFLLKYYWSQLRNKKLPYRLQWLEQLAAIGPLYWPRILLSLDYASMFSRDKARAGINNGIARSLVLRINGPKILRNTLSACEKVGMKPFLIYGTLLGHYRDKGFIKNDWDIDLGLLEADIPKVPLLTKALREKGIFLTREDEYHVAYCYNTVLTHLDIYYFFKKNDKRTVHHCNIPKKELYTWTFSSDIFEKFNKVKFLNKIEVLVPDKTEKFLTEHYGPWWIPKKELYPEDYQNITIEKKEMPE